jgi:hypothetical protein
VSALRCFECGCVYNLEGHSSDCSRASPPSIAELIERLRDPETHREAAEALSTLNEEVERLRTALLAAANAMTCGDDDAHYCPNCDNSLWNDRSAALAALQSSRGGE